ncbi:hypothetical protein [Micromonospora cathayae]|uniref:Uncharacterized protein n=1 Tax=Micromonospora cathayae TaxID=3028804 RepID=A0ABY7ZUB4_9ACTN|nr:hypothetical protein [Micromonospora sp. HUAS 3]WDZ86629.1 hypothetical protein PVK37_09640 [Micromonospora sp. HUAS 3]
MTHHVPPPGGRLRDRWVARLLAASLAVGTATAATLAPGLATAAVPVAEQAPVTQPGGGGEQPPTDPPTPTDPPPTVAPPTVEPPVETPPPPTTDAPEPSPTVIITSAAPTTAAPSTAGPRPTVPSQPPRPTVTASVPPPGGTRLGVRVTTGDVRLTEAYWNAPSSAATLQVTVTNTGEVAEQLSLTYTLPSGVTDAGTPGCAATGGGSYRCGAWTTAPGARFSTLIRVRVAGTAWRQMPLDGTVSVTATAPGEAGSARDDEGFAVLFPPGPPVPGIALEAGEVAFDISGGPSTLEVRLGNTGTVDADGLVEVTLPDGLSAPNPPAGCADSPAGRTRCQLGPVPAGRTALLRLPVVATADAQRQAPLAGAVAGQLDPRSGQSRRVQMSFRITAVASLATPVAGTPQPTGSQGVLGGTTNRADRADGLSSAQQTAIALIVASGLLVVLALTLATTSLRRRLADPRGGPTGTPTPSE